MNKHIFVSMVVLIVSLSALLVAQAPNPRKGDSGGASIAIRGVKPIKVLMITGGCCHDYENQKRILSEGIARRANVTFDIVHEGGDTRDHKVSVYEKTDWAKGYDVVLHNECFGHVTDDAFIENIANAHSKGGVAAVMLHCTMHSYRNGKTDEWRKTLGVSSFKHEKKRALDVQNIAPDHPVMKGFPAAWHTPIDELYMVEKFWDTATPLAKAYGQDTKKDHTCIWLNEYGKARVFSTTLGHNNESMESEIYLDLVTRGLLWAAGKLDDNGKPAPGYGR